ARSGADQLLKARIGAERLEVRVLGRELPRLLGIELDGAAERGERLLRPARQDLEAREVEVRGPVALVRGDPLEHHLPTLFDAASAQVGERDRGPFPARGLEDLARLRTDREHDRAVLARDRVAPVTRADE